MYSRRRIVAVVAASYLLLAVAQSWPLAAHLGTALTGDPAGDTGVYVWNTWVFRHELLEAHGSPFQTSSILALGGPADLSLHNYTVFNDLLALPLQPLLGVVATFNVIYLLNAALAGFGMFLLARRTLRRVAPEAIAEPWLAGALFACGPFLVARSLGHFSLAAAAPLPFFVAALDVAWHSGRKRDAALAGLCLAWAAFSDPYYGVYCAMLGAIVIAGHLLVVHRRAEGRAPRPVRLVVDLAIAATAAIIVGVRLMHGGGTVQIGPVALSIRSLYNPVMALTLLVLLRVLLALRPMIAWRWPASLVPSARVVAVTAVAAAMLMAPQLAAMATLAARGHFAAPPVLWRSSAVGLDLLAFFAPNPMHPLAPSWLVAWLASEPGWFAENVASVPFVALLAIAAAIVLARHRPSALWLTITIGFGLLALGPFLQVAGVRTFIPTPWTFLRYAPLIGEARMPPRFAVVVLMGVAVLFAGALVALAQRFPARRRLLLATAGVVAAVELCPAPRTLYSAEIPAIYDTIAADPRPVRVLELPYGVRDGLSSIGDFSAISQFYQTRHGKPIVGGYKSRISEARKQINRRSTTLGALMRMSEGRALTPSELDWAYVAAAGFPRRQHIGYVVMHTARTPPALRRFAIEAFDLVLVDADRSDELYVPRSTATPR